MCLSLVIYYLVTGKKDTIKGFFTDKEWEAHACFAALGFLHTTAQKVQFYSLLGGHALRIARYIYLVALIQFIVDVVAFESDFEDMYWIAWVILLLLHLFRWYDRGYSHEGGEEENKVPLIGEDGREFYQNV